jgi:hypothetical protein
MKDVLKETETEHERFWPVVYRITGPFPLLQQSGVVLLDIPGSEDGDSFVDRRLASSEIHLHLLMVAPSDKHQASSALSSPRVPDDDSEHH